MFVVRERPPEMKPYFLRKQEVFSVRNDRKIGFAKHSVHRGQASVFKSKVESMDDIDLGIPGLKRIYQSEKPFVYKILWAMIILTSLVACVFQITDRIMLFVSEPVITQTVMKKNYSLKLPAFTLCHDDAIEFDEFCPPPCTFEKKNYTKDPTEWCRKFYEYFPEVENVSEIWEMNNVNKKLIWVFTNKKMDELSQRSVEHMFRVEKVVSLLGTCNTYIADELIYFQGEAFYLYFNVNHHLTPLTLPFTCLIFGCRFLHHPDQLDVTYLFHLEHKLIPLTLQFVYKLKIKEFRALNTKANPCDTSVAVDECRRKCLDSFLVNKSNITCRLPYMKFVNLPWCTTRESIKYGVNKTTETIENINYDQDCACPRKCEELTYEKSLDDTQVSTGNPYRALFGYTFLSNVIELTTESYGYTIISLLCDIGGNLGLFLGLSLPSILEFLETMVTIIVKRKKSV